MTQIHNPILTGFNPDPSICRAGDDYYIATSTFEWFPGVQIHHSKDLVNWRLLTRPLTRLSQLDMRGDPDSGGIWAPCLTYADGQFWLIYTDVKSKQFGYLDTHNYLVTAPDIMGPWSEPVYLNSSGFDPSLFHDDDGRKWLVNMQWNHRAKNQAEKFNGILLQEYDHEKKKLVGTVKNIFKGTPLGISEGPHLYKRDNRYYLMVAEGGTGYAHAESMARSEKIDGPYETDPEYPIITAAGNESLPLQKTGHADFVETQNGKWYLVHLCSRPVGEKRRCPLGRETGIQECYWTDDGWLRVENREPKLTVAAPGLPEHRFDPVPSDYTFDEPELDIHFQTLRRPIEESWCSLKERPGHLRLYGQESLFSHFNQSIIARRIQAYKAEVETVVDFDPVSFQQMAGLTCYYDIRKWYYLHLTYEKGKGRVLSLAQCDLGTFNPVVMDAVTVPDGPITLRAVFAGEKLIFAWSADGSPMQPVGPECDATILSDDYGGGFTGAFAGMCCQDLGGTRLHADFDRFSYREAR